MQIQYDHCYKSMSCWLCKKSSMQKHISTTVVSPRIHVAWFIYVTQERNITHDWKKNIAASYKQCLLHKTNDSLVVVASIAMISFFIIDTGSEICGLWISVVFHSLTFVVISWQWKRIVLQKILMIIWLKHIIKVKMHH